MQNTAALRTDSKIANRKVIVGVSGGVDSSVAAFLLREQGYEVEALFMKNWEEDDDTEYCTARADLEDATQVCAKLGVPLRTVNFAREYWDRVFEHFLEEYQAGRTPNPDILCNKEIKFRAFLDHALALGADCIATGHYARLRHQNSATELLKGIDADKDQSYFLHAVNNKQLARSLFPLGEMQKSEVRNIAARQGLVTHDKKDSTGICFIGERRFSDFLARYVSPSPGAILNERGEKIGEHNGLMFHTLGQRQGLGIGGVRGEQEKAWYVAAKNILDNTLTVVQGNEHPALFTRQMRTVEPEWVNDPPSLPLRCKVKIRYRQSDQACTVSRAARGLSVHFDRPQRSVTPGQSAVFYADDVCLGGAVISAEPSDIAA